MNEEKTVNLTETIKERADEVYYLASAGEADRLVESPIFRKIAKAHLREQGWYSYHFPISTGQQKVLLVLLDPARCPCCGKPMNEIVLEREGCCPECV